MIKIFQPHLRFILYFVPFFLILGIFGCFFSGCASRRPLQEPSEPIDIGLILVMPFQNLYQTCGIDGSFKCPFFGSMYEVDEVRDGADEFLTDQLFAHLKNEEKLSLIEPGQALGVRAAILSESTGEMSEKELVLEVARTVGAQSVILGRVFDYRERVGTAYSVDVAASVAFDIILLRVSDEKLLWADHFAEKQKPLSENLFLLGSFIKRGGRWLTADELAEFGLKQILKTFPDSMGQ
ncbi:MAG: hypothetical protein R6U27_14825 [Desulfobacterales bacterium]